MDQKVPDSPWSSWTASNGAGHRQAGNNNNGLNTYPTTSSLRYFACNPQVTMKTRKDHTATWHAVKRISAILILSVLAFPSTRSQLVAASSNSFLRIPQSILQPYLPIPPPEPPALTPGTYVFTERHLFEQGIGKDWDKYRRLDARPKLASAENGDQGGRARTVRLSSMPTKINRLQDRQMATVKDHLSAARYFGRPASLPASDWTLDEMLGPNVTNKDTIVALGSMSANAYDEQKQGNWDWVDQNSFNYSDSFGWDFDGLQGHVFADESNKTIVVSIKGTSMAIWDGVDTTTADKENDNLFFSCCCGQGGYSLWRQVCDCATSTYTCNSTCLGVALMGENRYYKASLELYGNITELYPESNIWLTGHSLGGGVSSFLGLTFGHPAVTFESPGTALPAYRLGLPSPPDTEPGRLQTRKNTGIYNIGHTADPVFMGTCNTATSGCTLAGYALETGCHFGLTAIYDTVTDYGFRVSVLQHRIRVTIESVYKVYKEVPEFKAQDDCFDCYNWKYYDSNHSEPTSTSSTVSSTSSLTRTETCKTPGWWGCLDETTTTSATSTSSATTATTTSTCTSRGWFGGCLDPTTTTTTASPATLTPTPTSPATMTSPSLSTTCLTPGLIYGCRDKTTTAPSEAAAHVITAAPRLELRGH